MHGHDLGHRPLTNHRYPSATEHATRGRATALGRASRAKLRSGDRVIASYAEHPLFVATRRPL